MRAKLHQAQTGEQKTNSELKMLQATDEELKKEKEALIVRVKELEESKDELYRYGNNAAT